MIYTGGGADLIIIGQGESAVGYGSDDSVMDWTSAAKLQFAHAPKTAGEYAEATAGSFAQANLLANQLISTGAVNVVAVAVGNDVAVYADSADDDGVADDMVFLAGRTLADVSYANFEMTAPPSGGNYFKGTAGADTLHGTAGADTLDGGAGGDVIYTGGGADLIVIGQGESPSATVPTIA